MRKRSLVSQVSKGETFLSETDTEVIPKLCRYLFHARSNRTSFSEVCKSHM